MKRFHLFMLAVLIPGSAIADGSNLQLSAAADVVLPVVLEHGQSESNRLGVRSVELMLSAPVDHLFDGAINFAAHSEGGEVRFELHEGYIGSSKLIPRSRFRVGKFFLGVGRLNQFHQHDWPFVSAPKVHREFLDAEGVADLGGEYGVLLPTPFYLDLTVGVTNGYCYGHCHVAGQRPKAPVHYLHPVTFVELGATEGLQLGTTYLGRTNHESVRTYLLGFDATYKYREGKVLRRFLQSELWFQEATHPENGTVSALGGYVYPQYGLDEQWSLGLRLDGYSVLNRRFITTQEKRGNLDYAIVPTLSYKPSEFSTCRLAYTHAVDTLQGEADSRNRQVELQMMFILGSHPAHEF